MINNIKYVKKKLELGISTASIDILPNLRYLFCYENYFLYDIEKEKILFYMKDIYENKDYREVFFTADSENIVFIDEERTLISINITTKEVKKLKKFTPSKPNLEIESLEILALTKYNNDFILIDINEFYIENGDYIGHYCPLDLYKYPSLDVLKKTTIENCIPSPQFIDNDTKIVFSMYREKGWHEINIYDIKENKNAIEGISVYTAEDEYYFRYSGKFYGDYPSYGEMRSKEEIKKDLEKEYLENKLDYTFDSFKYFDNKLYMTFGGVPVVKIVDINTKRVKYFQCGVYLDDKSINDFFIRMNGKILIILHRSKIHIFNLNTDELIETIEYGGYCNQLIPEVSNLFFYVDKEGNLVKVEFYDV
ncbi:MAG: hypothetical protein U0457_19805 [Candidatus Sericytochromatia bacterium]